MCPSYVLAVVMIALAAVAPVLSQAPLAPEVARPLIGVPGLSLGPVTLGMTKVQVFNRLGIPWDIERDGQDLYWIYRHGNGQLVISWTLDRPEDQAGVDYLFTNAPEALVGGLMVGQATIRQAVNRYGWWVERRSRSDWFIWPGLRLRFDGRDTLTAFAIIPKPSQ